MKKKISLLVLLTVLLTAMAACSQPAADINSTEDTTSAGKEDTKDISGEPEEIVVKKTEYGTKEVVLEGKNLDELTVTGTDNPYYCNLEENLKMPFSADDIPIYVCKNPVYDITYYVNYGRDNYIYAYRNGTSELAVEIPARDLFCKEGELYFIAETDGQYQFSGFTEGNILKYNPMDGSVSVVVDCNAKKMIVYPDCICYKAVGERKETGAEGTPTEETVIYSFATGQSSTWPENADSLRRWNGYWLQNVEEMRELLESDPTWQNPEIQAALAKGYTVSVGTGKIGELKLLDAQGNEVETLQNVAGIPNDFFIIGDFIYYVEKRQGEKETEKRSVLRRYNKQTGTKEDVVVLGRSISLSGSDMMIHNNVAYFIDGLRVELDTGAQCLMQKADGVSPVIKYFYTDGEKLFCVSEGKLWLFEEQPSTPRITMEFVSGIPLEIGTYVYRLCEP